MNVPPGDGIAQAKERGITKEVLSPSSAMTFETFLITIEPGGISDEKSYGHVGEEGGYVMSGTLELWVGCNRTLLEADDSFQFNSSDPHRIANPGTTITRVLWTVSPPYFFSHRV
jgi:uncharacterized cupin superfamily protein